MKKEIDKKTYDIDEEVAKIADEVLKKDAVSLDTNIKEAVITYIKVYPNISPTVAGRCIRSSKLLKFFSDSDIIIEVSGELWDAIPYDIRYVLMLHELKHIGISFKKDGTKVTYLVNHDVQDFYDIIKKYGIDWLASLKSQIAKIEGFEDGEEDKIRL